MSLDEAIKIKKEIKILEDRKEKENESLNRVLGAINSTKVELADLEREVKVQQRIAKEAAETAEGYVNRRKEYENILDGQNEEVIAVNSEITSLKVEKDNLEKESAGLSSVIAERKSKAELEVAEIASQGTKKAKEVESAIAEKTAELEAVQAQITVEEERRDNTIKARDNNIKLLEEQATELKAKRDASEALDKEIEAKNTQIADIGAELETVSQETAIAKEAKRMLDAAVIDLDKEIKQLEADKKTADDEYKASTAKIIALADRELELNQKEDYIKERYKEAGIKY